MRTLQVYDIIGMCVMLLEETSLDIYIIGMCVVLLEETSLDIYKQAQELGTVDEFCKTDAKLFFSFSYRTFLKWCSLL